MADSCNPSTQTPEAGGREGRDSKVSQDHMVRFCLKKGGTHNPNFNSALLFGLARRSHCVAYVTQDGLKLATVQLQAP